MLPLHQKQAVPQRSKVLNFDSPLSNSNSIKRLISRIDYPKTMECGSKSALLNTRQASTDISFQNAEAISDENNQFSTGQKIIAKSLLSKMKSFDTYTGFMVPNAISLSFDEAKKVAFSRETSPFNLKNKLLFEFSEFHREDIEIEVNISQDLSFKDDMMLIEEAINRADPSGMANQFDFSGHIFLNEEDTANKQKNKAVFEILNPCEIERKDDSFSNDFKQTRDEALKQILDSKKSLSKLNSEFEVLELLGSGSFGVVYKCKSHADSKIYAVKISNKKMKGASRDRAINEENVLKTITSFEVESNIVKYYGSWTEDDKMCLLMEYCPTNLKDLSKNTPKFTEQEIIYMIEQLSLGLEFLHSHDIVHMDVKPENILVDQKNNLKLADFGLSRITSPFFRGDFDDGDSRYMAPELLNLSAAETNAAQLKTADIFSLGMTIYEMITKIEIPARGIAWKALRSGDFSALNQIQEISFSIKELIKRMIDPEPRNRPSLSDVLQHIQLIYKQKV